MSSWYRCIQNLCISLSTLKRKNAVLFIIGLSSQPSEPTCKYEENEVSNAIDIQIKTIPKLLHLIYLPICNLWTVCMEILETVNLKTFMRVLHWSALNENVIKPLYCSVYATKLMNVLYTFIFFTNKLISVLYVSIWCLTAVWINSFCIILKQLAKKRWWT